MDGSCAVLIIAVNTLEADNGISCRKPRRGMIIESHGIIFKCFIIIDTLKKTAFFQMKAIPPPSGFSLLIVP
jgi:hypothetical protein